METLFGPIQRSGTPERCIYKARMKVVVSMPRKVRFLRPGSEKDSTTSLLLNKGRVLSPIVLHGACCWMSLEKPANAQRLYSILQSENVFFFMYELC